MSTELRISIARDLSSITEMFIKLRSEAVNRAGDPEFPGGAAMVMLGPGADVEAWGYVKMSALFGRLRVDKKEKSRILKEDLEPPLSFLASWADIVRDARGQEPSRRRATISDEVAYLRSSLDWMLALDEYGEPWFIQVDDFATRLEGVRRAMENVLYEGKRLTRIRVRCMYCDQAPRLARQYVDGQKDDAKDFWFCPNKTCNHLYDADGVQRARDTKLMLEGVDGAWVSLTDAAATTRRSVRSLRTWTQPNSKGEIAVQSRRHPVKNHVEVYWPDVRDKTRGAARRDKAS